MNNELNEKDYAAIGLSPEQANALQTWALERVGYVFDRDACGGSGVFVKTRDNEIALLTAHHVVMSAILSGELTVGAYEGGRTRFRPPSCIIFSSKCDAALIVPQDLRVPVHLDTDEWRPIDIDVNCQDKLLAAGLPGEWKGRKDLERRVVESARVMLLWSEVTDVRSKEIETLARWNMPSTLGGMSGGPLFTFDHRLLGVHRAQRRELRTNEVESLISTRRHLWCDLFDPSDAYVWPPDLEIVPFCWESRGRYGNSKVPIVVAVEGWFGTSRAEPSHPRGAFGLIQKMLILNTEETRRYTINVWSHFFFEHGDDQSARTEALRYHVREVLGDMDIAVEVPGA